MTRRQRFILFIGFTLALNTAVFAQPTLTPAPSDVPTGRIFTLYGDLRVFELEGDVSASTMFDLILYSRGNEAVARQRVGKGGRYSFNNIIEGNYLIARGTRQRRNRAGGDSYIAKKTRAYQAGSGGGLDSVVASQTRRYVSSGFLQSYASKPQAVRQSDEADQ